jgi:hypothetical protein
MISQKDTSFLQNFPQDSPGTGRIGRFLTEEI